MTLDAAEYAQVTEVAQRVAAEAIRNLARGTGGANMPIPVTRPGTVGGTANAGDEVQVRPDGDLNAIPATNATGLSIAAGDRVLISWIPPLGVYVVNILRGSSSGTWTPAIGGPSSSNGNTTSFGYYHRIGRLVRAWGSLTLQVGGSWGTAAQITGFPWPSAYFGGATWTKGTFHLFDSSTAVRYPGWIDIAEGASVATMYVFQRNTITDMVFGTNLSTTIPTAQGGGDNVQFEILYTVD